MSVLGKTSFLPVEINQAVVIGSNPKIALPVFGKTVHIVRKTAVLQSRVGPVQLKLKQFGVIIINAILKSPHPNDAVFGSTQRSYTVGTQAGGIARHIAQNSTMVIVLIQEVNPAVIGPYPNLSCIVFNYSRNTDTGEFVTGIFGFKHQHFILLGMVVVEFLAQTGTEQPQVLVGIHKQTKIPL